MSVYLTISAGLSYRFKFSHNITIIIELDYLLTSSFNGSPIVYVVFSSAPFKILNIVVILDFVFVVDFWKVVWIRNKSKCDKPMNSIRMSLIVLSQVNNKITPSVE